MKKYLTLCLILATSFSIMAKDMQDEEFEEKRYYRLKVAGALPGTLESEVGEVDTGIGIEGFVEGVYRPSQRTEVAAGIGFQGHGNMETTNNGTQGTFYSVPLYVSLKSNLFGWPLYGKALGGVALNFKTSDFDAEYAYGLSEVKYDHGTYWALGAGVDLGRFEVEALYSVNSISFAYKDGTEEKTSGKILDKRITLGLSYSFDAK